MIMEHHFEFTGNNNAGDDERVVHDAVQTGAHEDPKDTIQKLKRSIGGLRLAPRLITEDNLWAMGMLLVVCQSTWSRVGHRAREVKTPQDNVAELRYLASGGWQDELKRMVSESLRNIDNLSKLGLCHDTSGLDEDVAAKQKQTSDMFDFFMRMAKCP